MRIAEAQVLLNAGLFAGAFYLAGYAVECGLKAAIAKGTRAEDFPDKPSVERAWKHDLKTLLGGAGLESQLTTDSQADPDLGLSWGVTLKWNEQKRYDHTIDQRTAADLYTAISDPNHGVLQWLRKYW